MQDQVNTLATGYAFLGEMALVSFFLFFLACPICSAIVADSKGRSGFSWFFLGLVFGPFGLLAAVGVTAIDREEQDALAGRLSRKSFCRSCRETIWAKATICPHCQTLIEKEGV